MDLFYLRNPSSVCVSRYDSYLFVLPHGECVRLEPIETERLSTGLGRLATPVAHADIHECVDEPTLEFLVRHKIVLTGPHEQLAALVPWSRPSVRPCRHLVLCVTGAVAAMHTPSIVFDLFHHFAETVEIVVSESAKHFVNPEVFSLLGIRVWEDAFDARDNINVPHVHLAKAAELVVVWPTSAHTLHKLATGACSDLMSLVVAASRAPTVLIPAMNHVMWANPAVSRNVARLRADGFYVVEPTIGVEVANKQNSVPEYGNPGLGRVSLRRVLASVLSSRDRM
jgi:phosphopantothenoylcysteine decarboxylase/phosphopantothenate--cysteine ligase